MKKISADEYHDGELNGLKDLWDTGNLVALSDAVQYCQTVSRALPEWAALAVLTIINHHHHTARGKAGAHGSFKGRLIKDYAHYLRWRALKHVLRSHGLSTLPEGRGRYSRVPPLIQEAIGILGKRKKAKFALACEPRQFIVSFKIVEKHKDDARFKFNLLYSEL